MKVTTSTHTQPTVVWREADEWNMQISRPNIRVDRGPDQQNRVFVCSDFKEVQSLRTNVNGMGQGFSPGDQAQQIEQTDHECETNKQLRFRDHATSSYTQPRFEAKWVYARLKCAVCEQEQERDFLIAAGYPLCRPCICGLVKHLEDDDAVESFSSVPRTPSDRRAF